MDLLDLSNTAINQKRSNSGQQVEDALQELHPKVKINHNAAELVHDTVQHIVQSICKSASAIRRATAAEGGDDCVSPEDIQTYLSVTWPDLLQPLPGSAAAANAPEPLPSQAATAASKAHRHVQRERYMQAAAAASISLAVSSYGPVHGRGAGSATPGGLKRARDGGSTPEGRGGATPGSSSKRAAR